MDDPPAPGGVFANSVYSRRFSCRHFQAAAVDQARLSFVLEAARWAPSAGNLQPWRFFVVRRHALKQALADAAHRQHFVAAAPVVVVVCAVPEESARVYGVRGATLYCLQDSAAATENLLLAATEVGLAGCWVGAFDDAAVAAALSLPAGVRPVALVPLGVPAEAPPPRRRRPSSETVGFL